MAQLSTFRRRCYTSDYLTVKSNAELRQCEFADNRSQGAQWVLGGRILWEGGAAASRLLLLISGGGSEQNWGWEFRREIWGSTNFFHRTPPIIGLACHWLTECKLFLNPADEENNQNLVLMLKKFHIVDKTLNFWTLEDVTLLHALRTLIYHSQESGTRHWMFSERRRWRK